MMPADLPINLYSAPWFLDLYWQAYQLVVLTVYFAQFSLTICSMMLASDCNLSSSTQLTACCGEGRSLQLAIANYWLVSLSALTCQLCLYQVALALAETELESFEKSAGQPMQLSSGPDHENQTASLIQQFRSQKRALLLESIERIKRGLQKL